ncbi:MAG: elongation factor P [Elusimicrobia bacterium]|nr:elongation factor P [Elusimicrobiota bacterium]
MIEAVDLRPGSIFEEDGKLFKVLKFQHHRMSQSAAVCRTKLRDLRTGNVLEKSYRSTDRLKTPEVEKRPKTFLYFEDDLAYFMDMTSYETIPFPKNKIGDAVRFLTENLPVEALYIGGELLDVLLPSSVAMKVASAPPGIRGDSATNPTKPVELENGATVQAPVFIKEGDTIKVDTYTGEYVERVTITK